jgi:hypothetical protein
MLTVNQLSHTVRNSNCSVGHPFLLTGLTRYLVTQVTCAHCIAVFNYTTGLAMLISIDEQHVMSCIVACRTTCSSKAAYWKQTRRVCGILIGPAVHTSRHPCATMRQVCKRHVGQHGVVLDVYLYKYGLHRVVALGGLLSAALQPTHSNMTSCQTQYCTRTCTVASA